MEGSEKRKSLRLTLSGVTVQMTDGTSLKVNNISLEGINLQGNYPVNSIIQGTLNLSDKPVESIKILIVNNQKNSSGGVIIYSQELFNVLSSWFNPQNLIASLQPSDITENKLCYEDYNHKCKFVFEFNQAKKINKVEISIYENLVSWGLSGWQTGNVNKIDSQPDTHKIILAKNLIKQSPVFPQSFKDWLLELN